MAPSTTFGMYHRLLAPLIVAVIGQATAHCASHNPLAGTWTLTFANLTTNGTTVQPYGDHPRGFLFMMPSPDYTWIEEIDAPPGSSASDDSAPAQANGGYYEMDSEGVYLGRTTLTSTIPTNVGISDTKDVLDLQRVDNTIVQKFYPGPGVDITIIWTKWVPGSTTYPERKTVVS